MQTEKPTFDTLCISETYPTIKGSCIKGAIDIYDEQFNLIKSVISNSSKFFVNLDGLTFKAILIKNTGIGYTASEYSNILIKCHESLPCTPRVICDNKPQCTCQPQL